MRERLLSEALKRGYTDEEICLLYELARFFLENGQLSKGETVLRGITEVASDFGLAFVGLSYIAFMKGEFEDGQKFAEAALNAEPNLPEATLAVATFAILAGDLSRAGTLLGEIGDRIANVPEGCRFYHGFLLVCYSERHNSTRAA